jgi:hypothetical protein
MLNFYNEVIAKSKFIDLFIFHRLMKINGKCYKIKFVGWVEVPPCLGSQG